MTEAMRAMLRKPRKFEELVKQRAELLRRLEDVRAAKAAVEREAVAAVLEGREAPSAADFEFQEKVLLQALDELRRQMEDAEREYLEREAERVQAEINELAESLRPYREAVEQAKEALRLAEARLNEQLNRVEGRQNMLTRLLESIQDRIKELEIGGSGHPAVPSNARLEPIVQQFREREPQGRGGLYQFDSEDEADAFQIYKAEKSAIVDWLRRCRLHRMAGTLPPLPPAFVERWPRHRLAEVAQEAGMELPAEWVAPTE